MEAKAYDRLPAPNLHANEFKRAKSSVDPQSGFVVVRVGRYDQPEEDTNMLAWLISTAIWAAPYQQNFHPTAAIPLQLRHHATAGFTEDDWEASLIIVTTAEDVTFKLTCDRNSDWKFNPARFLRAQTNFTSAFRESAAQSFQQELLTAEACQARVADIIRDPAGYSLVISEGKALQFNKIPKAGGT